MTRNTDLLPEGLEDCLPTSAARITTAMRACLDALDSHGYDRVRPPLLEFENSLASRMAGNSGGVRTRRMFRMIDPVSLRTLALRSDITPQIGRIAATSMKEAPRPLRLAYCGDTALIKASQLNPARERLQLGAELIGADTVEAAAESVLTAIAALKAAGITGISVDFTMPDLVETLVKSDGSIDEQTTDAIRRELDTKDAGGLKAVGGEGFLPLLYATGPIDKALSQLRDFDGKGALTSRLDGLAAIAQRIGSGARVTLDPTERHGFEYQSWFGFTLYAEGLRGAIGRGGTYQIGGTGEAATGFTLYLNALAQIAPQSERARVIFLPFGYDLAIADRLRTEGWRTKAQLSDSDDPSALGCTHTLEFGKPAAL
ncbi:MAG: ATP phosphoribosyltransferase regulatory subunit [Erythrobacter sp.]|uniref:ATP phosphoribosyltransferase regulatory subunit n=1 Tax=Erythrobacter sp. TaxID=1042 RepID=UPI003263F16C